MRGSSIRDIVVDTTRLGIAGKRNSTSFGTTSEGAPDNIRVMYGLNGCGKTVMLNTVHEIFRPEQRGRYVMHARFPRDTNFSFVETIGEDSLGYEKSLKEEFENFLSQVHPRWKEHQLSNHHTIMRRWLLEEGRWLEISLYGLPDEIKADLRRLGDGRYDWAYLWDGKRYYLELKTKSELTELLRERELSLVGTKQELIDRLCEDGVPKINFLLDDSEWLGALSGSFESLVIDESTIQWKVTRSVKFEEFQPERIHWSEDAPEGAVSFRDVKFEILDESVDHKQIFSQPHIVNSKTRELVILSIPDNLISGLTECKSLTKAELKEKLRERGKKISGNKPQLQRRLEICLRKDAKISQLVTISDYNSMKYHHYNTWNIQEEVRFQELSFEESKQLLSGMLPFTAEQIDSTITSASETQDPEERRIMLEQVEEMEQIRDEFYKTLGKLIPISMSIIVPIAFTRDKDNKVRWRNYWSSNGLRILEDLWNGTAKRFESQNRKFTNFSTVHLDVDRVSLAEGIDHSEKQKEAALGLEEKVDEFWAAYKSVIAGHETLCQVIISIFRKFNRSRRRLGKESIHIKFDDGGMDWGAPGSTWEDVMGDLEFLNTETVEDEFIMQVDEIIELFRNHVSLEENEDVSVNVFTEPEETKSFRKLNRMIYRIIPAMNFLSQATELTNLNLTMPRADTQKDEKISRPFQRYRESSLHADPLRADELSSGEKHLFSMLLPIATASMLSMDLTHADTWFGRNREHVLLLIDEPEISLHVNWQTSLVDSVERALKDNVRAGEPPVSVIFATHSPAILGNHMHRSTCLGPTEVFHEE